MSGTWYYTYSKMKVEDSKIPSVPHFAVIVYRDHAYMEAGRDKGDSDERRTARVSDYYAFTDKVQWEQMISDIYAEKHKPRVYGYNNDNENIVFFRSSGRGSVEVKVNVHVKDIDEDDSCNPMHNLGYGRGD